MSEIGDKVVSLKMDAKQFNGGVNEATSKMSEFANTAKSAFSLASGSTDTLAGAVDKTSISFSGMGQVAFSVLDSITRKAVDAGLSMANSFIFDPPRDGLQEYETKMTSIQSILANTAKQGTTLEDVTKTLEDLNQYADNTVYSFADMTTNLGRFTNAGLGAQESADMIKGFSNEAALAGTSAERMAGATYQLSQALTNGVIRLQDWNSLANAGMGGTNMKDGLVDIADAMGTLEKSGISAEKVQADFNHSLEKGWLTSDVMSVYLRIMGNEYSNAQMKALGLDEAQIKMFNTMQENAESSAKDVKTFSQLMGTTKELIGTGWATTFENIFGDFEEAKTLWTGVSNSVGDVIKQFSGWHNNISKQFGDLNGIYKVFEGIGNIAKTILPIFHEMTAAFSYFFGETTGAKLYGMADAFARFSYTLIPTTKSLADVGDTFSMLFSILDLGRDIASGLLSVFKRFFEAAGIGSGEITKLVGSISRLITKLVEAVDHSTFLSAIFDSLGDVAEALGGGLRVVIDALTKFIDGITNGTKQFSLFDDLVKGTKDTLLNVSGAIKDVGDAAESAGKKLVDKLGVALSGLSLGSFTLGGLGITKMFKMLKGGGGASGDWKKVESTLQESLISGMESTVKAWSATMDSFAASMEAVQKKVNADYFIKLSLSVMLLAGSLNTLASVDAEGMHRALTAIAESFGILTASMFALKAVTAKDNLSGLTSMLSSATSKFAVAGGKLDDVTKRFNKNRVKNAAKSLEATKAEEKSNDAMSKAHRKKIKDDEKNLKDEEKKLSAFGRYQKRKDEKHKAALDGQAIKSQTTAITTMSVSMLLLSTAMRNMADAVKEFSSLDMEELTVGLLGVSISMSALAIVGPTLARSTKGFFKASVGITALSGALMVMVYPLKKFSEIGFFDAVASMTSIAASISILLLSLRLMPAPGLLAKSSMSLMLLSGGLSLFAKAADSLADSLKPGTLLLSMTEVSAGLALLSLSFRAFNGRDMIKDAKAFGILSASVAGFAVSFGILAQVGVLEIAKQVMVLAPAIMILSTVLKKFGLDVAGIAGIGLLAKNLIKLGVATLVLQPVRLMAATVALSGLAAALPLIAKGLATSVAVGKGLGSMGIGLMSVGAGSLILSAALLVLGPALASLSVGLMALIPFLYALSTWVISQGPQLLIFAGEAYGVMMLFALGISMLSGPIAVAIPLLAGLGTSMTSLGIAMALFSAAFAGVGLALQAFGAGGTAAVDVVVYFVTELLGLIPTSIGILTSCIGQISQLLVGLAQGLATAITAFMTSALQSIITTAPLISQTIVAVLTGIAAAISQSAMPVASAVATVLNAISMVIISTAPTFGAAIAAVFNTMFQVIISTQPQFRAACMAVFETIFVILGEYLPRLVDMGMQLIVSLVQGIANNIDEIAQAAIDIIVKLCDTLAQNTDRIVDAAYNLIKALVSALVRKMGEMAGDVLQAGMDLAKSIIDGIVNGIRDFGHRCIESIKNLGHRMVDSFMGIFDAHSPSRLMHKIGGYIVDGLANGINADSGRAVNSMSSMGEDMVGKAKSFLDQLLAIFDEADTQPVITPVLDLSEVIRGSRDVDSLLNRRLDVSTSSSRAGDIYARQKSVGTEQGAGVGGTVVNYVQNNYSPKSLSNFDIYRQTKSQLALVKNGVKV